MFSSATWPLQFADRHVCETLTSALGPGLYQLAPMLTQPFGASEVKATWPAMALPLVSYSSTCSTVCGEHQASTLADGQADDAAKKPPGPATK